MGVDGVKGDGKGFVWRPERVMNRVFEKGVLSVEVTAWPLDNPPDYMEIDLVVTNVIRYYASDFALPVVHGATNDIYRTVKMLMRKIPAADIVWKMGKSGGSKLTAQRSVRLRDNYYIGVYPVTWSHADYISQAAHVVTAEAGFTEASKKPSQKSYNSIRGTSTDDWPGWPQRGSEVTAGSFADKARRYTGVQLDLATSAQWEFACRAGTGSGLNNGSEVSGEAIDELAWYNGNVPSEGRTYKVVGLKTSNAWGIYDMHGNIYELCLDWYENTEQSDETDPKGPLSSPSTNRVMRGGSVYNDAASCSSYAVMFRSPKDNYGFRLAAPCEAPASR
jgi:formylglycine-generating enzyme required for sulfatase activity